jgi:tripartite-type tricarboxylate transporter receptor subunit TctC
MATELAENSIDLTIGTVGASAYQAFADHGLLRAVAVIDATRSPYMPNVLTLTEQGFAKVEGFRWTAFFVSAAMPQARRDAITAAIRTAMRSTGAAKYELLPGLPQRFLRSADEISTIQQHEAAVIAAQIKAGGNL